MEKIKESLITRASFLLIGGIYGVLTVGILILCVFFSGMDYAWKTADQLGVPNMVLLAAGILFLLLLYRAFLILDKVENCKDGGALKWILPVVSLLFLALQIHMVEQYYFHTGWDAGTVLNAAVDAATGHSLEDYAYYLSAYPNNLMIIKVYALVITVFARIGLNAEAYYAVLIFQCVICWLTGLLVYDVTLHLQKRYSQAYFAYTVYLLLAGLSPWVSIPYTDAVALIFPVAVLALYVRKTDRPGLLALRWFLIAGISWMGFKIKPQVLILTIAIVMVQLCLAPGEKNHCVRTVLTGILAFAAGIFCAAWLSGAMINSLPVEINPEQSFGLPHYLMMGLNTESMGVYENQDVKYSESFSTVEERTRMDLLLAGERLRKMGPGGLFLQLCRKVLTNYNDGTFCWGGEGAFYDEILEEKSGWMSPLLRNMYYNGEEEGVYYRYWSCFMQLLWLAVLTLSAGAVIKLKDPDAAVMLLAVVGLGLFQIIFEARGRYLYHYVPVYVMLGTIGLDRVRGLLRKQNED